METYISLIHTRATANSAAQFSLVGFDGEEVTLPPHQRSDLFECLSTALNLIGETDMTAEQLRDAVAENFQENSAHWLARTALPTLYAELQQARANR